MLSPEFGNSGSDLVIPYSLYRRESVKAGSWHYVVMCKGCGKPIYLLDDPTGGVRPVPMPHGTQYSAPCLRCHHHDIYDAADFSVAQSAEDIPGARPERVRISKSSRKPLRTAYPKATATFGVGYVEDRPNAAAIVGRIVTAWADIEVQCARLLAELVGTTSPAATAVFGSLRSSRAQHDALQAAAKIELDDASFDLFAAHMARRSALEKERNDIAHGCVGVLPAIPDGIAWVSQSDYLTFIAALPSDDEALRKFRECQAVYELGTLERIAQEIEEFHGQLGAFRGYLVRRREKASPGSWRSRRYTQLCNQPHIRQALDRIQAAKKEQQAQQPKPRGSKRGRS